MGDVSIECSQEERIAFWRRRNRKSAKQARMVCAQNMHDRSLAIYEPRAKKLRTERAKVLVQGMVENASADASRRTPVTMPARMLLRFFPQRLKHLSGMKWMK